jgi:hypothetical protein
MVLQLKLRQAEIAALQLQLKASQRGSLDLAAVAEEEAAIRQENKEMRQQLENLAHHPHVRNLSTRFAVLNAELTVKKVDYDYVHDARCSIQSYNRELRRQALQFAREKEVLAVKLQDIVTRQTAAAAGCSSPSRRRSTLLTQQRVALEAAEMQQWREQQEFESKQASAAARISQLEAALAEASDKADKGRNKEVELMAVIADLKEALAQRDEHILAASTLPAPCVTALITPSKAHVNSSPAVLCLSPQITGTSNLPSRVMSPSASRPPPSPSLTSSRSEAALAAAEAQIAQVSRTRSPLLSSSAHAGADAASSAKEAAGDGDSARPGGCCRVHARHCSIDFYPNPSHLTIIHARSWRRHTNLCQRQKRRLRLPRRWFAHCNCNFRCRAGAACPCFFALTPIVQECEMQRDTAEAAASEAAAAAQHQKQEAQARLMQVWHSRKLSFIAAHVRCSFQ